MHSQVQGLKVGRFQARVKLAPPHRDVVVPVLLVDVDWTRRQQPLDVGVQVDI